MEEEDPWNGGWAKDGEAEEPAGVAGASATGRKGTGRSEKAKDTKSHTPSTRIRGPGWRIHGGVEDTKLSTNKQHSLS